MQKNSRTVLTSVALALGLAGCASATQNPTNFSRPMQAEAIGAATGAIIGAPFGGIGAPIGAIAGGLAGGAGGALTDLMMGKPDTTPGSYRPIYFGEISAAVNPNYRIELDNAAATLLHHPYMMTTLTGYTDD